VYTLWLFMVSIALSVPALQSVVVPSKQKGSFAAEELNYLMKFACIWWCAWLCAVGPDQGVIGPAGCMRRVVAWCLPTHT